MDKLVHSQIPPIKDASNDFAGTFEELASKSDSIRIASGYISTDSIVNLKYYVESLGIRYCELLVGMHAFDGITRPQFDALKSLDTFLHAGKLGGVGIFTAFPFHGKMYLFSNQNNNHAAILGSSNLSGLERKRQFEVDWVHTSAEGLVSIDDLYHELRMKATKPLHEWSPRKFSESTNLLGDCAGVEKLTQEQRANITEPAGSIRFSIPLKSEPRSNLNVFFGKGRLNSKTGVVRPRPWYEVEIIVPKAITSLSGYPTRSPGEKGKVITVCTDDGWKFRCKISGDYSKNFRSDEDLKTLGLWIKGRMEIAGALKPGDTVTEDTLKSYGRKSIDLISTNEPDIWLLEFGV